MGRNDGVIRDEFVQSLERGLSVIQCFGEKAPSLTLTEVASATSLTRATARRFLLTLERMGHIATDGKYFRLTPHVLTLGYAYLSSLSWWHVAEVPMGDVVRKLSETCAAATLDDTEVIYLARVPASRIMSINLSVGSKLPAYCTSLGRVLLAFSAEDLQNSYFKRVKLIKRTDRTIVDPNKLKNIFKSIRVQGYCIVDQELEIGVRAIAVPIFDRAGRVVAALNVGTQASRVSLSKLQSDFFPVLKEAALKIRSSLPYDAR
ncbi:MAG: helix-turn-helix domain-containing protein [Taibaiella sp.]|nr:helix-turn-helix domain-containing protein [Taibaiella sp.]